MGLVRGDLPSWAASDDGTGLGYGLGYGLGSGDGSGSGYGAGTGSGYGYGYGSGYGYGLGSGDGYGSGDGAHTVACSPDPITVTVEMLEKASACRSGVSQFATLFPSGASWPADRDRALVAGMDVAWAEKALGLLRPA